ncbi:MAG TPA: hypothetical protein DIW81_30505 [Planctomycetaceae bacterium]|nr:hypothetical protein [Rubinisphaera sp.]HCS55867.1 hypothetical protein [Planctomycetaceae bacterium]
MKNLIGRRSNRKVGIEFKMSQGKSSIGKAAVGLGEREPRLTKGIGICFRSKIYLESGIRSRGMKIQPN